MKGNFYARATYKLQIHPLPATFCFFLFVFLIIFIIITPSGRPGGLEPTGKSVWIIDLKRPQKIKEKNGSSLGNRSNRLDVWSTSKIRFDWGQSQISWRPASIDAEYTASAGQKARRIALKRLQRRWQYRVVAGRMGNSNSASPAVHGGRIRSKSREPIHPTGLNVARRL